MLRVVGIVIASARVGEDGQSVTIESDPLGEVAELLGQNGQLATAPGMRADGVGVEMADPNSETFLRSSRQCLRAIELVRVEIDMRVKVADGPEHGAHLTEIRAER